MSEVGVSILCLAFNHEKYIKDTIEGFLMQKTTFPIEIIINEDCSTDDTATIIHEYEKKYPKIIKPIYQKRNVYSQGININAEYMLPLATGKYVALCEGDDYWTDPLKLQKQYEVMEANVSCQMCLHRVKEINDIVQTSNELTIPTNELKTGIYKSVDFMKLLGEGNFFNEVCYFFRREEYTYYQKNYRIFAVSFMKNRSDDVPMLLYFGQLGDIYYINESMAVYRRFTSGSWSEDNKNTSKENYIRFCENSIKAYKEYNVFTSDKYAIELERWPRYFSFKKAETEKNYKEMILDKYADIFSKQSNNYQRRIKLQAKFGKPFIWLFQIKDRLNHY